MKFVDEVTVVVAAGNGGSGCLSFARRANFAKGGPDGGNGGTGGSVYLVGDSSLNTLVDFRFQPRLKADNGQPGGSSNKSGSNGKPLEVRVPCGTTVIDEETLHLIGDVTEPKQRLCVAEGGGPGRGNASFKSSTNRAPRQTTRGGAGATRQLRLQLRVLADVGLLGMPNAGKSTLVNAISASRPKIADYPFTTLHPTLGVVRPNPEQSFVVADVPGLIRGASQGQGLGPRFMRHLTRTSILLHLIDVNPVDGSDPCTNIVDIEQELQLYSETLAATPIFTVVTKIDTVSNDQVEEVTRKLSEIRPNRPIFAISSITGAGMKEFLNYVGNSVDENRQSAARDADSMAEDQQRDTKLAQDVADRSLEERRALASEFDSDPDEPEVVWRRT